MKKLITLIIVGFCLVSLCFASPGWDNTLPADSSDWDDAAGYIRDNWDALETAFGVDLVDAAKIMPAFNVKHATYGAEGDGETNDRTAIQAAIDAANAVGGGVVFFPESSYLISSALVPKSNVILRGEEGSIILFTGIIALDTSAAVDNFTVEKLIFNGQSGASSAIKIDVATSTYIKIQECEITGCGTTGVAGYPISIIAATHISVINNNIHDNRTGITITNCDNVIVSGNLIDEIGPGTGGGEVGINIWATAGSTGDTDVKYVTIADNVIRGTTDNGIRVTAQGFMSATAGTVNYVSITGNVIEDPGQDGIRFNGSNITVTGNVIVDAGISAVRANTGDNNVIANNVCVLATTRGTTISAGITVSMTTAQNVVNDLTVTGNVISGDEWRNGITLNGDSGAGTTGQGAVVANNTIIDTGTATTATAGANYGITISRWNDILITGNRLDNTYEGISFATVTDGIITGNYIVNCVDGSGRAIRTNTVTRVVVSGNYLYGNTLEYELDSDDTSWMIETEQKIIDVTAAQIKALAATQKELVPAPGASKYLEFVSAILILDDGATNYADAASLGNMVIRYVDGDGIAVSQDIEADAFIDATVDTMTNAIPKKDAIAAASVCVNKALVLDNDGSEFTTGDGVMQVIITYRTHTSLGL